MNVTFLIQPRHPGLNMAACDRVPQIAWLNFPGDIAHFVAYFVAHEAHHRGQLILLARSLGRRLPDGVTNGLWQWTKHSRGSL